MSNEQWLPRSVRDGPGDDYYRPRDGVPPSLLRSVTAWLAEVIENDHDPTLTMIERRLEEPLNWTKGMYEVNPALKSLLAKCQLDSEYCLDVIDLLISFPSGRVALGIQPLKIMLDEARTLWRVAGDLGSHRLERIVGPELETTLDRVLSAGGRPADYLRKAWAEVFGRHPASDSAYRDAIRAIEAAAIAAVSPRDSQATLGKVLGELKANKSKFEVLLHPADGFDGVGAIIAEMDLLWKSQFDRHGTPDDDVPLNVSLDEAEIAVVKATSLVHCLNRGLLRPKESLTTFQTRKPSNVVGD